MANQRHDHDAPAMDYAEHEKTFGLFASLIKWGTVFSVIFLLLTGSFTGVLPWMFTLIISALCFGVVVKFF
ncbi:Cytochrome c oxidase, subunit IV, bacterial aa3 type [Rhabdaerophilaceae bacterium]